MTLLECSCLKKIDVILKGEKLGSLKSCKVEKKCILVLCLAGYVLLRDYIDQVLTGGCFGEVWGDCDKNMCRSVMLKKLVCF